LGGREGEEGLQVAGGKDTLTPNSFKKRGGWRRKKSEKGKSRQGGGRGGEGQVQRVLGRAVGHCVGMEA